LRMTLLIASIEYERTHMGHKLLLASIACLLTSSAPLAAAANGMPMGEPTGTAGAHSASPPGGWSGNPNWHGGRGQFHSFQWHTGHWWHGRRDSRLGWWWNVGPNWYWYPAAIYPYPDPFTPPHQSSGYWYWCDFYQNYYPNVASCPSEWEVVGPQ
jgi:hypothetical protein